MGRIAGVKREKITISISHGNLKKINEAILNNQFSNVSEAINGAVASYFENVNRPSSIPPAFSNQFKDWILTNEGKRCMKDIIREVIDEEDS